MTRIKLPLFVERKGKCYHINLNNYRNWNRYESNWVKKSYQKLISPQIPLAMCKDRVSLDLVMHRPDRRKVDRANVLSIHEKFACDALVAYGFLMDDSDKYIESSHYYTGEIDSEDPRVDLIIRRVK